MARLAQVLVVFNVPVVKLAKQKMILVIRVNRVNREHMQLLKQKYVFREKGIYFGDVVVAVIFLRTSLIKHTINITSSSTCISLFYIYCFTSPLTFSLQSLCSSLFHFQSSVGLSPTNVLNRNDLDEELEEKVVDEGRRRWHRPHADISNRLDDLDAPIEDVDVDDGKELIFFLGDERNRRRRHRFITIEKFK